MTTYRLVKSPCFFSRFLENTNPFNMIGSSFTGNLWPNLELFHSKDAVQKFNASQLEAKLNIHLQYIFWCFFVWFAIF